MDVDGKLVLPGAPAGETGAVKCWREGVVMGTYGVGAAEKCPMFLERRVYQGSSGRVYPLAVVERVSEEKVERRWDAVHLENEFLRVMILPELGGRIHVGMDKTNGYDFFYRQNVIKPALVGLAGPWVSGGVEFNWPQHHRPSTFMGVDVEIERHGDGSITVWCGEHEPMGRMKGMHGVCVHPGRSVVELKGRVFNRKETAETFLWWVNAAVRVHEKYQSCFPGDVGYVADHAKRAMSAFPLCRGKYYGVDYGERARSGRGSMEGVKFVPPEGMYAANDLSWYGNIPVPTSYMAMGSGEDFFGGYDHAFNGGEGAGVVHVADRRIAPGKKQWTWGNHAFGYAWDRHLTDEDGPYVELMAGVWTDNQPDFSFLAPGETRAWSQWWYPIRGIGAVVEANVEGAVGVRGDGCRVSGVGCQKGGMRHGDTETGRQGEVVGRRVGVYLTRERGVLVEVSVGGVVVREWRGVVGPGRPWVEEVLGEGLLGVRVLEGEREVISWREEVRGEAEVPAAAVEPGLPAEVGSVEELYLVGVHLEQYRHATRRAEDYWGEALRREPGDVRCNVAMGWWRYRRGEFGEAAGHFGRAAETLTKWNPNPREGEAFYGLGVTLVKLGREGEGYDALYKATWNYAWQSAAFLEIARADCRRGEWEKARGHLERVLAVNGGQLQARDLMVVVLRKLGLGEEAGRVLGETLKMDRLDWWARELKGEKLACDGQVLIDLALEYGRAGLWEEGVRVIRGGRELATDAHGCTQMDGREVGVGPVLAYVEGWLREGMGDVEGAREARARVGSVDWCFPARLEELAVLRAAADAEGADWKSRYLLGNWMYDRRRYEEGMGWWEYAVQAGADYSVVWRNLGIGAFNVDRDGAKAREMYEQAFEASMREEAGGSGRIFYERDQLWKRLGVGAAERVMEMEKHLELVARRDDLSVEYAGLMNELGRFAEAARVLAGRRFQPWEGGEGLALGQHVAAQVGLGKAALERGDARGAVAAFRAALEAPENLGEAKHLLANQSDVHYWLGRALAASGDAEGARREWEIAASARGDFQEMSVRAYSEMSVYSALALRALGREEEAEGVLRGMRAYGEELKTRPAKIDYFATSLPTMLLFEEDLQERQVREGERLCVLAGAT